MRRMPLCEILFASRTNTDRLKKEGMQTQKKDKAKGNVHRREIQSTSTCYILALLVIPWEIECVR